MKTIRLLAALAILPAICLAEPPTNSPDANAIPSVSISSKGSDVRTVLGDLFGQAKKNYVIEPFTYFALHLSLKDVEFDEALMIVCKLANLNVDLRNGIYYVTKAKSKPIVEPAANIVPTQTVTKPKGKLPTTVLNKIVTTRLAKVDLRALALELGKQAGLTIEIDKDVPAFKLDAFLIKTSLKFGLDEITKAAGLEYIFTENQTLLIRLLPKEQSGVRISH